MEIPLQELGVLIARCWERAEANTASVVEEKYFDPPEECITFIFACELRCVVSDASRAGAFEHAFLTDLRQQFPDLAADALGSQRGLIARVNLHSRQHEGILSASDLGVVVTRPSVHGHPGSQYIHVLRDRSRGLIAQAKLNIRNREGSLRWGSLTKNQEKLLPGHLDYCALLFYQLEGDNRAKLAPFRWQLCRGFDIPEIKGWLNSGATPKSVTSGEIIRALSFGRNGTDSAEIVENIVDPQASRPGAIEIKVFWEDDDGPPREVYLRRKVAQEVQGIVSIRR